MYSDKYTKTIGILGGRILSHQDILIGYVAPLERYIFIKDD
jgi:hypothetical protein